MQPGMPQGFGRDRGEAVLRPAREPRVGVRVLRGVHPAGAAEDDGPQRHLPARGLGGPGDRRLGAAWTGCMFARVRVTREGGEWRAASTGPGQSNLISTVAKANGLADHPGRASARRRPARRSRVMLFRALEDERERAEAARRAPAGRASSRSAPRRSPSRVAVAECDLHMTPRPCAGADGRDAEGRPARGGQGGRPHGREADPGAASRSATRSP